MYMTSAKLKNKKAAMYVSRSIPVGAKFFYCVNALFLICTDADHVNGKGLLKRGRGSTGKKHEEWESKKGNKTDNWK